MSWDWPSPTLNMRGWIGGAMVTFVLHANHKSIINHVITVLLVSSFLLSDLFLFVEIGAKTNCSMQNIVLVLYTKSTLYAIVHKIYFSKIAQSTHKTQTQQHKTQTQQQHTTS